MLTIDAVHTNYSTGTVTLYTSEGCKVMSADEFIDLMVDLDPAYASAYSDLT